MFSLAQTSSVQAGVGAPQVATNHTWYPGELACSTFERLQETQAMMFEAVTGHRPTTDEQRVLASWLWRNTHYWHGEQGVEDLWDRGFSNDTDSATREYWTGLFAHGFALCGTTHSQWTAEMQHLLGHNRARVAGVSGHNSYEVFLKGGAYRATRRRAGGFLVAELLLGIRNSSGDGRRCSSSLSQRRRKKELEG